MLFTDENSGAAEIVMHPANRRILFAGMWTLDIKTWGRWSGGPGSGLFRSTDGGTTWQPVRTGLPAGDLGRITVPTLVVGARFDTMDPKHMEWMAGAFPAGRYLYCPNGSHLAMYDDQAAYFDGLIGFIPDVDAAPR